MEKIVRKDSGRYVLRSRAAKSASGEYHAVFVVTERINGSDVEIYTATEGEFDSEFMAVEVGLGSALLWLDEHSRRG